jgi:hypothetical protein
MDAAGALRDELGARWRDVQRLAALWVPAVAVPRWIAPGVAIGALLGLVIAAGVALASLGSLITALLVAYLLLERVFGLSIALA